MVLKHQELIIVYPYTHSLSLLDTNAPFYLFVCMFFDSVSSSFYLLKCQKVSNAARVVLYIVSFQENPRKSTHVLPGILLSRISSIFRHVCEFSDVFAKVVWDVLLVSQLIYNHCSAKSVTLLPLNIDSVLWSATKPCTSNIYFQDEMASLAKSPRIVLSFY